MYYEQYQSRNDVSAMQKHYFDVKLIVTKVLKVCESAAPTNEVGLEPTTVILKTKVLTLKY
jgi:hypothetical protein